MTAEVKGITCPLGQWTALAVGKQNVLLRLRSAAGWGRVVVAAATPSGGAPAADFLTLDRSKPISLSFKDTTSNVYLYPAGEAVTAEVVTE